MNKHDLIQQLSLTEHTEGGYFVESYRSAKVLPTNRPGGDRSLLTSIYYLLTDDRPIDQRSGKPCRFTAGNLTTYIAINQIFFITFRLVQPLPIYWLVLRGNSKK